MAPVNSSSKRKSSSSLKKKRSKPSSEAGRRKRSRSRKRNKSKKLRRDASISYSEDDPRTVDSISVSSSDSEDDYRSRKARSRTRGDTKGSRKRARRSSPSHDTDRGSPNRRKRKGSKRIRNSKERRKSTYPKNRGSLRSRRDASVSSRSSGSLSCSTCRGSSTDHERSRGRSEERDKYKRSPRPNSNGRYNSRHGLRSSSSCSTCDDRSSYQSEDRYKGEKHSRRLRSVVLTVTKEKEGNRNSRDDDRTEILQAYDDCPSCRSNDSYDGGRKRESSYHPHSASDKKRRVDDAKVEDTSKIRTTEIIGIGKENDGAKYDGNDQNLSMVEPTKTSIGIWSELPSVTGNAEGDDLELKLRQKALENLRKFRGGLHTNTQPLQKDENVSDGIPPSTAKIETVQNKPQKEDRSQLLGATQVGNQNVTPSMERKSTFYAPKSGLIPDQRHESVVKLDSVHPTKGVDNVVLNQTVVTGKLTEKNKLNVGINGKSKRESSVDQSNLKEAPISKEFTKEKLLEARNISNRSVTKSLKALPGSSNTHGAASNESRLAATEAPAIPTTTATEHCPTEKNKLNVGINGKSKRESSVDQSNLKEASTSKEFTKEKLLEARNISNRSVTKSLKALPGSSNTLGAASNESRLAATEAPAIPTTTTTEHCPTEKNKLNVGINGKSKRESSIDQSNLKEAPTSKEFTKEKLLEARNISNRSVTKSLKALPGSSNTHGAASNESRLSATEAPAIPTTTTTEHCPTEQQDEAKGSSQFEQKTMSVMRGGEMVQVSYKVYIPKKAPALARRQLQR